MADCNLTWAQELLPDSPGDHATLVHWLDLMTPSQRDDVKAILEAVKAPKEAISGSYAKKVVRVFGRLTLRLRGRNLMPPDLGAVWELLSAREQPAMSKRYDLMHDGLRGMTMVPSTEAFREETQLVLERGYTFLFIDAGMKADEAKHKAGELAFGPTENPYSNRLPPLPKKTDQARHNASRSDLERIIDANERYAHRWLPNRAMMRVVLLLLDEYGDRAVAILHANRGDVRLREESGQMVGHVNILHRRGAKINPTCLPLHGRIGAAMDVWLSEPVPGDDKPGTPLILHAKYARQGSAVRLNGNLLAYYISRLSAEAGLENAISPRDFRIAKEEESMIGSGTRQSANSFSGRRSDSQVPRRHYVRHISTQRSLDAMRRIRRLARSAMPKCSACQEPIAPGVQGCSRLACPKYDPRPLQENAEGTLAGLLLDIHGNNRNMWELNERP